MSHLNHHALDVAPLPGKPEYRDVSVQDLAELLGVSAKRLLAVELLWDALPGDPLPAIPPPGQAPYHRASTVIPSGVVRLVLAP